MQLDKLYWKWFIESKGSNPATPTLFSTIIDDFWSNLLITKFQLKISKLFPKIIF